MVKTVIVLFCMCWGSYAMAAQTYGERICKQSRYDCYRVHSGDTWNNLFPNAENRNVVKRLNRMNVRLRVGQLIAVPKNLRHTDVMDISPFPMSMKPTGSKVVRVNQSKLAWGAYDPNGRLVNWGPMSGGKSWCADVKRGCKTVNGSFSVYRKQGAGCKSSKYPRPNGGAKMPYCMHFYKGYALHGSSTVPGRHDSHGCVRLFIEDARWLNKNFIDIGTKVIVR